jgi:uncharacterized OsmC-like protein
MKPALAPQPDVLNGVDRAALFAVIDAVKEKPEIAQFNFRASNKWMGGDRNRTTIKDFTGACAEHREGVQAFVADNGEPEVLLGDDAAPNPVEWLLHALIGCVTTSTAYHAAAAGIAIDAIGSEIEGDLDLRGFLGLSPQVRKGYTAIRIRLRVRTDADADTIRGFVAMSPVLDVVSRSTPVAIDVDVR